ncbi:MAG: aminoglycoside phosphotransferase family protein [Actinomycetota bacterium]|nr:aminoglycoside phosphotransferase family protein [Actinomycetota bacterium]
MHDDQLDDISLDMVNRLVVSQFPEWADRAIRPLQTTGTMNAIFRVGDDLAARFPLRAMDTDASFDLLQAERIAANELAAVSPVPTPLTVAIGRPGEGYPLAWSVQTWISGVDALTEDPADSDAFALDLSNFVACLRASDTGGRRFAGSGRGGHLPDHDEWVEKCLRQCAGLLDVRPLRAMWAEFRGLPEVDAEVMCHGDLTPPNVLVRDGRLVGVLDVGGFGPADPARDLVSAWHLLDDRRRGLLNDALGCSDVQWLRGMAWAFQQAIGLVWYYPESNPTMSAVGRRTLGRLTAANR